MKKPTETPKLSIDKIHTINEMVTKRMQLISQLPKEGDVSLSFFQPFITSRKEHKYGKILMTEEEELLICEVLNDVTSKVTARVRKKIEDLDKSLNEMGLDVATLDQQPDST